MHLTGGVGADLVVENGGSSTLLRSLKATTRHGHVSSVGYLGKSSAEDLLELVPTLIDRAISLRGINVGSKRDLEQLCRLIDVKKLSLSELIDKTFDFDKAPEAFQYLASGGHMGKVVVRVA